MVSQPINIERHLIASNAPLSQALAALNSLSGSVMTLMAVDHEGRLVGTLTDGDVRRALLAGQTLTSPVANAMNAGCRRIVAGDDSFEAMRRIKSDGIRLVAEVDSDNRILRLIDTATTRALLPISAVLMAGGRGERLRPLTLTTPKPLLEVGGRAIIDRNIDLLAANGISDITVTVNYMASTMEEHFSQPVAGVNVKTVREPEFMGTLGAVALTNLPTQGTTLVMNSDLLTSIDLEEMYADHVRNQSELTIAAIPYNVSVPYAVLSTDGHRVNGLHEKPSYSYYANAGIYMISNRLLATLPKTGRTDATDFIESAIASGANVGYYPIDSLWIDIGNPADYRHACDILALSK